MSNTRMRIANFLNSLNGYNIYIYSFLEMLLYISLSKKLLTKVNDINIPWNTIEYIDTSHISLMYAMYFFF